MIGVLVNVAAVIVGSAAGLIFKKGISQKFADAIMIGLGLCVVYVGISGVLKGQNQLVAVFSMVIGSVIGTALDLDKQINRIGDYLQKKMKKEDDKVSISEGFVTASLFFCVGAMAIVGSLEAGLEGNNATLFTKSVLDMVSAVMLTASLGIGVIFSSVCVFVLQGGVVLLSGVLENILNEAAIAEMTCVGSLMIIALGLNIVGITKIKVANYLPGVVVAPIMVWLFGILGPYIPGLS